jgi:hypothetical protein
MLVLRGLGRAELDGHSSRSGREHVDRLIALCFKLAQMRLQSAAERISTPRG